MLFYKVTIRKIRRLTGMIVPKKDGIYRWMKWFIILPFLFQDYGRSMYLGKRIPVRWLCFHSIFANPWIGCHKWYFRNALVHANYNDLKKGNPLGLRISRTVFDKSIAWGTQSTSKPDMYVLEIKASRVSELLKEMWENKWIESVLEFGNRERGITSPIVSII